jgi:retron-type reverse transcriptase
MWMKREMPEITFERYADDIVVHCRTEEEARRVKRKLEARLSECGLQLHPEKTKIVYCKNGKRKQAYPETSFDFLGFTFRPRVAYSRSGERFIGFLPGISEKARKAIHNEIRSWQLQLWNTCELEYIAKKTGPKLTGWFRYYGKFRKSAFYRTFAYFQNVLAKWAKRKYKRFRRKLSKAKGWIIKVAQNRPQLFVHWQLGVIRTLG